MRVLALDLGTKTLGLAISDETMMLSSPLKTLRYDNENYEVTFINGTLNITTSKYDAIALAVIVILFIIILSAISGSKKKKQLKRKVVRKPNQVTQQKNNK